MADTTRSAATAGEHRASRLRRHRRPDRPLWTGSALTLVALLLASLAGWAGGKAADAGQARLASDGVVMPADGPPAEPAPDLSESTDLGTEQAAEPETVAPASPAAGTYSAPLRTAIASLVEAPERSSNGYVRELQFQDTPDEDWRDADDDGCDTRREVLIAEATTAPMITATCRFSDGQWVSYYDNRPYDSIAGLQVDHLVALAEAWDSGAQSWSMDRRVDFANDLGDPRALVAVTAAVNQAKGDRDPSEWLPDNDQCRYIAEWVAVKKRWRLTANLAEKATLAEVADGCPDPDAAISVTIV